MALTPKPLITGNTTRMLLLAVGLQAVTVAPALAQAVTPPPRPADAAALIQAFEGVVGQHPARRSFAKGVCVEGSFSPASEAATLSAAATFAGPAVPVIGRFAVGGGNPLVSDKTRSVRGFALSLDTGGPHQWDMAAMSAPFFFASTPETFLAFLQARAIDPATGRADPARIAASNAALPDTRPQMAYLAANPIPASYAGVRYYGINTFRFVNAAGTGTWVRWEFEPAAGLLGLSDAELAALPDDFLADELRRRMASGPVRFRMTAQIAEPGDVLDNPTIAWPAERRRVTLGEVTLSHVEAGAGGKCDAMAFYPLILPRGIEPSNDPTLLARTTAYTLSRERRLAR